jgi:hypothetical protein
MGGMMNSLKLSSLSKVMSKYAEKIYYLNPLNSRK